MGLRINQNIAAMNSYRNLSNTDNQMSKSLEKLSSGFRINRAADDAAGLAISEGLRSQVGGLKVAVRNSQDGISVVQTAEGALNESHSILQRMRDLSVQAANGGSLNDDAKQAIQSEIGQLTSELTRIADTTTFNGSKLLDGTYAGKFQVGANVGETIGVTIAQGMNAEDLGLDEIDVANDAAAAGVTAITDTAGTAATPAVTGVTATASKNELTFADDAAVAAYVTGLGNASTDFEVGGNAVDLTGVSTLAGLATAIDGAAGVTAAAGGAGVIVTADTAGSDASEVAITSGGTAYGTVTAGVDAVTAVAAGPGTASTYVATLDLDNLTGTITRDGKSVNLSSVLGGLSAGATATEKATALQTALVTAFGAGQTVTDAGALSLTATAVGTEKFVLSGQSGADDAISKIDKAIGEVSTTRADLGALQNRFDHTINNLNVTVENLSASESRIRDADMAQEMMQFTRNQILSQAGTAMLAQANQASQGVLSLLR